MKTIPPQNLPDLPDPPQQQRAHWLSRKPAWVALTLLAGVIVYFSNVWLTDRFTEVIRIEVEQRLSLNRANIISQLQRNSVVPLLLSQDPLLVKALQFESYGDSSQRLISIRDEIGSADLFLLDAAGRVQAATDRSSLKSSYAQEPFFTEAIQTNDTVFSNFRSDDGVQTFTYSRRVEAAGDAIGAIVVEVDLQQFERHWRGLTDAIMVTDSTGTIILSTEPLWRGRTVAEALDAQPAPGAIERALKATADWSFPPPDAYIAGAPVLHSEARIPFQGWRIAAFTAYSSVRERVWGVLALEITAFTVLLAAGLFLAKRQAQSQSRMARAESADLRALNTRLQREIAEREKAEKNLQVAEQTIAQSSKLAALGEMSAAVSHELNQPLAAMKTYLAGAKLLLQRSRPEEALSSFHRIDDLIERMGAITRQLKSYARRGEEAFEPVDFRDCLSSSLAMMEPQLKQRTVYVTRSIPVEPVMVKVDRLRLEQVMINLYRNALDATSDTAEPRIELILTEGDTATLMVRDNGYGIKDLENLFEPFYTTKAPGDGVGLGLAISSGIIRDLGGRMSARNADGGGAVFEVQLPLYRSDAATAAE